MNIFADQLVKTLNRHGHELSNLFSWKDVIPPNTVVRLKASLTTDQSATLNSDQLDFLASKYDFDEEDLRALRAALLAEAMRRMLADRLSSTIADQLGQLALQLLLSDDPETVVHACQSLVAQVRLGPTLGPGESEVRDLGAISSRDLVNHPLAIAARSMGEMDAAISTWVSLETAEEAYHHGLLWVEVAQDTHQARARSGYAAAALSYLDRAKGTLAQVMLPPTGDPQAFTVAQQQLRQAITTAHEIATQLSVV